MAEDKQHCFVLYCFVLIAQKAATLPRVAFCSILEESCGFILGLAQKNGKAVILFTALKKIGF